MKIKFYLKRPKLTAAGLELRKRAVSMYDKGKPVEEIMKLTKHTDPDKCRKYIEYLKDLKAQTGEFNEDQDKASAIFALINWSGHTLKFYTSEAIAPRYWNPTKNCARNSPGFPEYAEFNARLDQLKISINAVFNEYKRANDNANPSPVLLGELLNNALKKKTVKRTFLEYFEDFNERSEKGQRLDPRTKKPVVIGLVRGYVTTYRTLLSFKQTWRRKLDFDTIDLDFHRDFTAYLENEKKLKPNTIGSHFQRIIAVLNEATENGVNTKLEFRRKHFIKQREDADTIYLDREELQEIENLDLSENERLDNARDLFLVGAFTGLRHSDVNLLTPEKIRDGKIHISQKKTGKPVIIPIHPIVKRILNKRDGEFPRPIANQNLNLYLKEIGKMCPALKRKVFRAKTEPVEKWKLLCSHTARRSFATNMYKAGIDPIKIRSCTGHLSEKDFLKYIRATPTEMADLLRADWAKLENNLKAV